MPVYELFERPSCGWFPFVSVFNPPCLSHHLPPHHCQSPLQHSSSSSRAVSVSDDGQSTRLSNCKTKARSTPATMSKQRSTLLPKNGNNVERVLPLLRWNFVFSTKSNVASTLLLVWTGLNSGLDTLTAGCVVLLPSAMVSRDSVDIIPAVAVLARFFGQSERPRTGGCDQGQRESPNSHAAAEAIRRWIVEGRRQSNRSGEIKHQ